MEDLSEKASTYPRIGSLLVKMGFVKPDEVEKALAIQREYDEYSEMPLGLFMIQKGILSKNNVENIIAHPDIQKDIVNIVLKNGMIDNKNLSACLKKKEDQEPISATLVEENYINQDELSKAVLKHLDDTKLCKLMLKLHMINERDLDDVFSSRPYRKPLGQILYDLNLVTLSELHQTFVKNFQTPKLGEILKELEIINQEILEEVLQEQSRSGFSLGRILIRKRSISVDQLYFALSVQENLPFHKLNGFLYSEKQKLVLRDIVRQRYAEENLILPLLLNANNLTVAVSKPSNSRVVQELRALNPHLRISCVLITDEKFEQLFAILYGELSPDSGLFHEFNKLTQSLHDEYVISDPLKEEILIDLLYEKYKTLNNTPGSKPIQNGEALFRSFIAENFHQLREKYNCKKISFSAEAENGEVIIMASPMLECRVRNNFEKEDFFAS
jgi:hypothetical protein